MPKSRFAPNRSRREKVFGDAPGASLDGNAKARIMAYAHGYNVRHRLPRQHHGPLTRAFMDVMEALLWSFHNSRSGHCFPSYESIAARARCNRDTVCEAIKALEDAKVLTWVHRIRRERVTEGRDLLGRRVTGWRIVRTSNAYVFRDPLPCAEGRPSARPQPFAATSKSENPTGTLNQGFISTYGRGFVPDTPDAEAARQRLAEIRRQREGLLFSSR
jgi:hypothetical protein